MILESLYQPGRKDLASGLNQRRWAVLFQGAGQVSASPLYQNLFPVGPDTLRVLVGASFLTQPDVAASVIAQPQLTLLTQSGQRIIVGQQLDRLPAVGITTPTFYPHIDWIMGPGDRLEVQGAMSAAGTGGNSVTSFFWGYELPRGNVEL